MDLSRLLHPRTVAIVGATDRVGSYAGQTLLNLDSLGYAGEVWGVNPGRSEVYGRPCFPALSDLPGPPDAVVVAIPAAGVPAAIEEAGAIGAGGAVVYGAGFGETSGGAELERRLEEAARRHRMPVCGPNGNGIVVPHRRLALWGDALRSPAPGRVALVSQSGNVAVNALATRRGLRLHTVVSCGNSASVDPSRWVAELAGEDGVGAIALYLEADGDGAALCEALALCAERGIGVAVLKVGRSTAGSAAAAAHTGAVAGDQRVFRALVEEAGGAWAGDVHELLELAKAMAVPGARRPAAGLGVLTCSGGDSALAADLCESMGLAVPDLGQETVSRLRELLPAAATAQNPLDYTALIWGDDRALSDILATVAGDPAIERVLVLYDQPAGIAGAVDRSWSSVRRGILDGARRSAVPVMVAATLPELLDDAAAVRFLEAQIPAVAGLRTGLACAAALGRPRADPVRLREIGATARRPRVRNGRPWLAEHDAKELLGRAGVPVPAGRLADGEDDAVAALAEIGAPVALKLSAPHLLHKSELGALALGLSAPDEVRAAHRGLVGLGVRDANVLVERMAPPGMELLVAARCDAVVPCLVVGLGGVWTELFDDVAIVPLPAPPERIEAALRSLRGANLLTGARGRTPVDLAAAGRLAAGAAELLLEHGLELIELNPVRTFARGAVAVDAVAR